MRGLASEILPMSRDFTGGEKGRRGCQRTERPLLAPDLCKGRRREPRELHSRWIEWGGGWRRGGWREGSNATKVKLASTEQHWDL